MEKIKTIIERVALLSGQIDELGAKGESNLSTEEQGSLRELTNMYQSIMQECLGDPDLSKYIKCWVVRVDGKCDFDSQEVNEIIGLDDVGDLFRKVTGPIGDRIKELIESNKLEVAETNFDQEQWHILSHCTEEQSITLCSLLHNKFRKAISSNLLKVSRVQSTLIFVYE